MDIFGFIFPKNVLFHRFLTYTSQSKLLELFILCKFVNEKDRIIVNNNDSNKGKKQFYWYHKLKTYAPFGLNERDVYTAF